MGEKSFPTLPLAEVWYLKYTKNSTNETLENIQPNKMGYRTKQRALKRKTTNDQLLFLKCSTPLAIMEMQIKTIYHPLTRLSKWVSSSKQ